MPENPLAEENQFNILNSIRNTMIAEMQEFRISMSKITITINGVIILLVSWLFTKGSALHTKQKIVLSIGASTFLIICFFVTSSIKKHFMDHATVVNKINHIFGVYNE